MRSRKRELLILSALLVLGFIVRVLLIEIRWINPDEGAHLMDGVLFLDGLVPGLDFGARQLLYAQATGLAVWLFGHDLTLLRLFPVAVITLSGLVVHAIGRELWDRETGLVATAVFLFLPFSVMMTVQTKTEPLAILTAAGAVYWMVRARSRDGWNPLPLFVSGLCLGVAFYVRESTLSLLVLVLSAGLLDQWGAWKRILTSWMAVLGGLGVVTLAVFLYYSLHISQLDTLLQTVSNPYSFLATNVQSVLASVNGSGGAGAETLARSDQLSLETSLGNLTEAASVSVVLLVGTALTLVASTLRRLEGAERRESWPVLASAGWLAWIGVAYAFWTVKRGFFPAYFLEFLPPLSLLTAAGLVELLRQLPEKRSWLGHAAPVVVLVLGMGAVHAAAGVWQVSRPLYFIVTVPVLAVVYLPERPLRIRREQRLKGAAALFGTVVLGVILVTVGPRLPWTWSVPLYLTGAAAVVALSLWPWSYVTRAASTGVLAFVGYVILLSSLMLSLSESGLRLDSRYDGVWSFSVLDETAAFLRDRLPEDASVVSGAVIWAVEAERRPFADITHPIGLMADVSEAERERVSDRISTDPPDAFILDGFTRRTYLRAFPELARLLDSSYRRARTIEGSAYPVQVYLPSRRLDPDADRAPENGDSTSPRSEASRSSRSVRRLTSG